MATPSFDASWLRRSLVLLVVLKVVGIVLIFEPRALQAFDLPKSVFSRVTELAIMALLALALARYGPAIVPRTRLHLFVLAYLAATVLAAAFAENKYLALYGEYGRFVGLTFLFDMAVLYLAVSIAFRRSTDWLLLFGGIGVAFLGSSGYLVAQRLGLDPVGWVYDPQQRPFGTFGNSDMFGHFLSAWLGACLGLALFADGARSPLLRATGALATLATLGDIAIVATRGSALGVAAVTASLPIVYLRARGLTRPVLLRTVAGSALGAVGAAAFIALSPIGARVISTLQGIQVADRLTIYKSGLAAFLARPVLGYGPDNFAVAYVQYRLPESHAVLGGVSLPTSVHSWLLQLAVTTGAVGLASYLAALAAFAWSAWRALPRRPALVAPLALTAVGYLATGLVSPSAIMVDWIPWVVFGGVASLTASEEPVPARRNVRLLIVPALAVALVGVLLTKSALDADYEAGFSQVTRGLENQVPIAFATAATRLDSGRARYWFLLGSLYAARKQWRASGDAHEEAAKRAPYNASYWASLSVSRLRQALDGDQRSGGPEAAFATARRAIEADPRNPVGHVALAQAANAYGRHDLALQEIEAAIRLHRHDANYDTLAADIAVRADGGTGRRTLEAILQIKESIVVRLALARVELKSNDLSAARAQVRRVLELDPENQDARRLMAEIGN